MGMSKRGEYDTGAIENDVREACSGQLGKNLNE